MHRRTQTMELPLSQVPLSPPLHSNFPLPNAPLRGPKFSAILSKQWLHRTTFFALFSLFIVSTYVLLGPGPSNFQPVAYDHPVDSRSTFRVAMTNLADSNKLWKASPQDLLARPQISLTPEQELAAVSSFIISLPSQNIIPPSVDTSKPIDPSLVLDFDTRADGARAEMTQLVHEVWDTNPVVLYYKRVCCNLNITKPLLINIDSPRLQGENSARLSSRTTFTLPRSSLTYTTATMQKFWNHCSSASHLLHSPS